MARIKSDTESLYRVVTLGVYLEGSLFYSFLIPFLVLQRTLSSLKIINSPHWSYLVSAQYDKVSFNSFFLALQRAGLFWVRIESQPRKPWPCLSEPRFFSSSEGPGGVRWYLIFFPF